MIVDERHRKRIIWTTVVGTIIIACCSGYAYVLKKADMYGQSMLEQAITGKVAFSPDHWGGSVSAVQLSNQKVKKREMPWWNPYIGMGRMLYADAYHYGVLNPIQWFVASLFPQSITRQIAVATMVYTALIIVFGIFWLKLAGIHPLASCPAILLFLSSYYFSQGANFVFGIHTVYLALLAAVYLLETQFRKSSFVITFLTAPVMGWFLITARADVIIYFGFVVVVYTVAKLWDVEKEHRVRIICQGLVFLAMAGAVTAVQTLPLKMIGSASARSMVHHTGYGVNFVRGLQTFFDVFIFGAKWGSGTAHRVLQLVLGSIAIFEAKSGKMRSICLFSGLGLLWLFLAVSGVFDHLFLAMEFDMQPAPYTVVADLMMLALAGTGLHVLIFGKLSGKRYWGYVLSCVCLTFYAVQDLSMIRTALLTGSAILCMGLVESISRYQARAISFSKSWWTICGVLLVLGVMLVGNSPFYMVGYYSLGPLATFKTLGILKGLLFLSIVAWMAVGGYKRIGHEKLKKGWIAGGVMTLAVLLIMHITPHREVVSEPVESLRFPASVAKYFSKNDFRTLNVHGRIHESGMPTPFTYESVNWFFVFPMYSPFYPYLETSGGHSVAPLITSNFADLINFGYLWESPKHPRQNYSQQWKEDIGRGKVTARQGIHGKLQALKKSVVIFNADSPFLRYSATEYVVSHQEYLNSEYLELVDIMDSVVTQGRDFKSAVYREKYYVYRVLNSVPRAYVPEEYYVVGNEKEMIERMRVMGGRENAVILGERERTGHGSGQINAAVWHESDLAFEVSMEKDGFLVVSDPHFPGWKVWVDGKARPLERANYAFRAVHVPSGQHKVEFRYLPPGFKTGLLITICGLFLSFGAAAVLHFRKFAESGRPPAQEDRCRSPWE